MVDEDRKNLINLQNNKNILNRICKISYVILE